MIKSRQKEWIEKATELKKRGEMPMRIPHPNVLVYLLLKIDPFLLLVEPTIVHRVLGRRMVRRGETQFKEIDKPIISLEALKKMMESREFAAKRDELLDLKSMDDIEKLRKMAILRHQEAIINGKEWAIKLAYILSGQPIKDPKQRVENKETEAVKMKKLLEKVFKYDDVAKLEGNN